LVTLTAEKNCFQESFKAIKTVRISQFIWQRVPDCRAGVIKSPTAVRAKSAARNSQTIQVSGFVDEDGEEQHQRLGWDDQRGTEAPGHVDTGTPSHRACIQSSRGHSASGAHPVIELCQEPLTDSDTLCYSHYY